MKQESEVREGQSQELASQPIESPRPALAVETCVRVAAQRIRREWWPHLRGNESIALSIEEEIAVVIAESVEPEMRRLRSAIPKLLDE